MNADRRERVFLVRLWQERDATAWAPWRGSVHDVRSGRKRYITAPHEIVEFVTLRLDATDDGSLQAEDRGDRYPDEQQT